MVKKYRGTTLVIKLCGKSWGKLQQASEEMGREGVLGERSCGV